MQLRVLSAADVRQALPMSAAIEGLKTAFRQLWQGQATVPMRSRIDVPRANGCTLFMPAFLPDENDESPGTMVVKTVSVFGENPPRGLPTIHALVHLIDAETGRPLAILEGGSLTAIRTGAASGAATDFLARSDAKTVTIFGSGVQARTQLEAVCTVRNIERVCVYSPRRDRAERFAAEMAGVGPISNAITVADTPQQAVADAEIICAATTSATPVFDGRDLQPGVHVNAVGSYQPHVQEVDAETIRRSLLVVDAREAALEEAGDIIVPLEEGVITPDHIHAELGELAAGAKAGRTSEEQITLFNSCGLAVQDAVAARIAYTTALREDLGQTVEI